MITEHINIYSMLSYDKIKMNFNKHPIDMKLFLSFLTVDVIKSTDHLGYCNGWTLYINDSLNLLVSGGIVNGKEYLDSVQFGNKLQNKYNNYVNPFYLFDILTNEGKLFFNSYYEDDIIKLIEEKKKSIFFLKNELIIENKNLQSLYDFQATHSRERENG